MNIVEDLAEFYKENENSIIRSIEPKIENCNLIKICQKTGKILEHIYFDTNRKPNKELSVDDNYRIKFLILNSKYLFDDANNSIDPTKQISSTVPNVIKFVNTVSSGKNRLVYDRIVKDNLIDKYFNKIIEGRFGVDLSKIKRDYILSDILDKEPTHNTNLYYKYEYFKNNVNKILKSSHINNEGDLIINKNIKILKGSSVLFIIDDSELDTIRNEYNKYLESRLFLGKEKYYSATNSGSTRKFYRVLNENINYPNYYYNNLKKIDSKYEKCDVLLNYAKFMNIIKAIPNKYLVTNKGYINVFDSQFTESKISEVINDICKHSKSKNTKVLHFSPKGEIIFYDSLNLTNIKYKYKQIFEFNKNSKSKKYRISNNITEKTKYNIYRDIMSLLDNNYISFFGDNSKKNIHSNFSDLKLSISSVIECIKEPLFKYLYLNSDINISVIYDKVEKFLLENKLYFKKENGIVKINSNKIYKIIELNYNIKNKYKNMQEIIDSANLIKNSIKLDKINIDGFLNDIGKKEKENISDKYKKWLDGSSINLKYLNKDKIREAGINIDIKYDNTELFSYVLGVLLKYELSHSISPNIDKEIIKFKKFTNKEAIDKYLSISDKYTELRESKFKYSYDKFKEYILFGSHDDDFSNKKVDYIMLNLGFIKSKEYLYKK